MDPLLLAALEPVLLDLRRSGLPVSFRAGEYEAPGAWAAAAPQRRISSSAMLWADDGVGTGIQVNLLTDDTHRIAALANVVQDLVIEDELLQVWPRCPLHPNGGHPLIATVRAAAAMWECPSDATAIAAVGTLPA